MEPNLKFPRAIMAESGESMLEFARIEPKLWRDFYSEAFRECGGNALRRLRVAVAITACLGRLLEISPRASSEREQITFALEDLQILRSVYKKYS